MADFYAAGMVDAAMALHYGCVAADRSSRAGPRCRSGPTDLNDPAFEIEYTPYGVDSGLCVGVATTAFQDEGVTLQPCGVSSKTVWIVDARPRLSRMVGRRRPGPLGSSPVTCR